MKVKSESEVAQSCPTLWDPMDIRLLCAISQQEYWSGLLFPSPGDLPDPGIKSASPALAIRFFTAEPPGKLNKIKVIVFYLGCERDKKWRDSGCAVSLRVGEK